MFEVYYRQLDGSDAANKYISLPYTPLTAGNVALDTIGGTAQSWVPGSTPTGDFFIDGTKVRWDGCALDGILLSPDNIRVIYDKS